MWSQNETKIIKKQLVPTIDEANPWFALPSPHVTTNHVNHVNHDSAINELVNQAATKSHQRSSLDLAKFNMRMVMKLYPLS